MPALQLSIAARSGPELAAFLRRHLTAAHRLRRSRLQRLSLALVGDALMARLHERHLGIPGPTDVLTFVLDSDARGRTIEGEIVVCVPEARRQARRRRTAPRHEALLYAIHGLLHLEGMDDTTPDGFSRMHAMEDRLLRRLGIGAVFAAAPRTAQGDRR
jgi:probable rRNA maturation factor